MKKNKINQEENIILDEETKNEDKKKPTAKKIAFAILLILLAVMFVVLGFCVVGGVFDVQTQCNVAYAYEATLPDDGKVGDNLLLDSSNFSSSIWNHDPEITVINTSPNLVLRLTSSVSSASFYQKLLNPSTYQGVTLTCSAYCKVSAGSGAIGFRYRSSASGSSTSLGRTTFTNTDYQVVTFTATIPSSALNQLRFSIYCNSVDEYVDIMYLKVEVGSAFTGFVRSEEDLRTEYDALSNWRFYYTRDKVVGIVSPLGTGMYKVDGIKHYISKDTNLKVFLVPYSTKISDIINDDFTLKLKIKGLNTDEDVTHGISYQLFDLTGYREFYYICAMSLNTPQTVPADGISSRGKFYSYDTKTKSLYEITPHTFPDKTTEERYLDIVNFYEDFGRKTEQSDFNSTTNGIISVIESPVNFLKDVFNFEIFGINVSAVVFFVLSIVIVAFVIKKVV